uniref:Putative secreted protein n=1 Tax=Anopheles darlingi TaxID=43151 RepID=A0A2M4DMI1_ANODA
MRSWKWHRSRWTISFPVHGSVLTGANSIAVCIRVWQPNRLLQIPRSVSSTWSSMMVTMARSHSRTFAS